MSDVEPTLRPSRSRLLPLKLGCLAVLVVVCALDLWSKARMQDLLGLVPGQGRGAREVDVLPGFLAWQGTWNPGVTFGLAPNQTNLIMLLTGIATVGLLVWFLGTRSPSRCLNLGLALILGGALGNLYDRWNWGQVRDFVLVYVGDLDDPDKWTWPNFNVADSGIVVGVGLVLWDALFGHGAKVARERVRKAKEGAGAA